MRGLLYTLIDPNIKTETRPACTKIYIWWKLSRYSVSSVHDWQSFNKSKNFLVCIIKSSISVLRKAGQKSSQHSEAVVIATQRQSFYRQRESSHRSLSFSRIFHHDTSENLLFLLSFEITLLVILIVYSLIWDNYFSV